MLANEIATKGFPMLRLEDTASFVLQCMEDYEVQHLPILKEEPVIFEFRIPWLFLLSIWSWLTYLILLLFIVVY